MKTEGSPKLASSSAFRLLPYVLFAISLLASAALWWYADSSASTKDQLLFERRVVQARARIVARIEDQLTLLRATAAAISVDPEMTRNEFHGFARSLKIGDTTNGVMGIGFARRVPASDVPALEERMRQQDMPDYHVFPRRLSGDQYPIVLLEPYTDSNRLAIGFDMFSEAVRQRAMQAACDTAEPVATGKVALVQDRGGTGQPGFLVYVPIYSDPTPPLTVAARRDALIGFAYSPLHAADFFGQILTGNQAPDVSIEVHADSPAGTDSLLFLHRLAYPRSARGMHQETQVVHVAGMDWTLKFYAPSYVEAVGSEFIIWIPFVGLIVSLLVFLLVSGQIQTLAASQKQAADALRREKGQRFLAEAGKVLAGSLDSRKTLDEVAALAVPQFADWCAIDLPSDDGGIERVSVRHSDPGMVELAAEMAKRHPTDPNGPSVVATVFREGKLSFLPKIGDEQLKAVAQDDEHLKQLQSLNVVSGICAPMNVRGETLGTITFVSSDRKRIYGDEEMRLAEEIAARAAVALDNARLFEAAQREVSERTRAEAKVRDLNTNLERLVDERTKELRATNRELEAFCYSVSHDLRTPLRSLDGFSKALIDDYGDRLPAEGRDYLDRVRAGTRRMDELITALLILSRITRAEINREPIDISAIASASVQDAVREFMPTRARVKVHPGLVADADARMVRIVFDNLIGNALKFSAPCKEQSVEVGVAPGERRVFFVRDEGVGFNPEYSNKLFAPFERLHSPREFPGSGIGLATVQRIVQRHGGDIWAESEEGKGATFYFTLG